MPKKHLKILAISSVIYITILSLLSFIKYQLFLYNALDLAIFTDVFTSLARYFTLFSSIQGHSYLQDHVTPILLFLLPLFTIAPHALTLLVLQSLILGFTSFVVYQLAVTFFAYHKTAINHHKWALFFALAWLANPLVWNTNLFEFHLLPIAAPLLFGAGIFYYQKKFTAFILSLILACLVREDISLIVAMFGIIAWIDKRPWKYRLTSLILGFGYFAVALHILSLQAESFRFFVYYSWLGNSIPEIILTILTKPQTWIPHVVSIPTIEMLVGLLFPFALLPLIRPKWLLLALFPLGQFVFGRAGGSGYVFLTHYSMLFLPALLFATLAAIHHIVSKKGLLYKLVSFDVQLSKLLTVLFVGLVLLFVGPIAKIISNGDAIANNIKKIGITTYALRDLAPATAVASSYNTLPHFATQEVYSLHYIFLGNQQFSNRPYILGEKPEYVIMDTDDLVMYDLQLHKYQDPAARYHQGVQNIQTLLKNYTPHFHAKGIISWQRGGSGLDAAGYPHATEQVQCNAIKQGFGSTYFCTMQEPNTAVYQLAIQFDDDTERIVPFIWREYHHNSQIAYARFELLKEEQLKNPSLAVISRDGHVELGPFLNIIPKETNRTIIETITIK